MLFMERRNISVRKSRDAVAEIKVTFDGVDRDSFEITEIDLIEPTKGFGIRPPDYPEDDD